MTSKIKPFLVLILLLIVAAASEGKEVTDTVATMSRPVIGSYRVETGRRTAYSTYLSPFSYHGTSIALSGFWTKVLPRNPEHLSMHFETRLNYASLLNPAGTASELDAHANVQWGMMWQTRFSRGWTAGVGGSAGVYGGLLYLLRNSNNPVSAQFAMGISASGYLSRLFILGKLPVLVSDRLNIPLAGGFFCQEYGEPYYEIYLGNTRGLAHFGWPGNRFGIDNLLMLTLDLGRTAMEIGYRLSFQNEHANNLTTRFFCNAFVIGVVPGGLGIKVRRNNAVTPLY